MQLTNTKEVIDRPLLKVGGAMAIVGSLMGSIGNILHPRSTEYYGDAAAWLNHNVHSDIWFPSHVLILVGMIIWVSGFVALAKSFRGTRGEGIASLGLANALVGSALMIVTMAIDGLVVPQLDGIWQITAAPSPDAVLAGSIMYYTIFSMLYVFMMTLFGLTPLFFGSAMLLSKTYPSWLGWSGVVIGAGTILTAVVSMLGVATEFLDANIWPIFAGSFGVWVIIFGVMLWRRAK